MATLHAISGVISRLQTWISGAVKHMRTTSTIWIVLEVSSMSDGEMLQSIVLLWHFLKIQAKFIGKFRAFYVKFVSITDLLHRFRDIGYQHIPYFNCPNSPKCKGCQAGRFTDGEAWLHKEDCRANWFKYVGMG